MAAAAVSNPEAIDALGNVHAPRDAPPAPKRSNDPFSSMSQQKLDVLSSFPVKLESELCWTPESFPSRSLDYVVQLSVEEVKAIDDAVAHFKDLNLRDIALVCPENFPLPPEIVRKLRSLSATLHDGRGFAVLRGLHPQDRAEDDNVIAFCGIGSYIGRNRAANENGFAMDHLRDASKDTKQDGRDDVELHPSKMMAPLKFHADRKFADILALFIKSKAPIGGQQYLSSFWTTYNKMMESCPDDLRVLAEDFPWPGVVNDQPETTLTPVIFHKDGRVLCQLVYRIFEGTNLLSDKQWKALDALERIANENAIELDVHVGDIQLVNNLGMLHARRGWVDRPGMARHYYRLGLHDPELAWAKPEEHEEALFYDHLRTEAKDQTIPVTDFDPYGLTSLSGNGHG